MKRKKVFKKFCYIFLLILILLIIYIYLISINLDSKNSKKQNDKFYDIKLNENIIDITPELEKEFNNSDIVGTIKIEGTDIDTMLVQAKDNEYYLNHSYDKSSNSMGAIFIDYRNSLEDKKILIYGHNFRYRSGGFHELTKYVSKDFYNEFPYIEIVINDKKKQYLIFSVMIEKSEKYPHTIVNFSNTRKYLEHLYWLKGRSIYDTNVEINENDYIITLQTCYYNPENSYLIINAKQV